MLNTDLHLEDMLAVKEKKRGRPRKAEATSSTTDNTNHTTAKPAIETNTKSRVSRTNKVVSEVVPTKRKSRAKQVLVNHGGDEAPESVSSTTDIVSEVVPTKRKTRVRQAVIDHSGDEPPSSVLPANNSTESSTPQQSVHNSSILDEATAFTKLKHKTHVRGQQDDPVPQPVSVSSDVQKAHISTTSHDLQSAAAQAEANASTEPSHQTDLLIDSSSVSKKSTFLSDFLNKNEPAPETTEDSRISDRAAFNTQIPTIEEIVTGTGVSNLSTLEALQQPHPSRASAIPITPPKTFKSHGLKAFPNTAEQSPQPAKKQIDPATYATGSFSTFKRTQPLSARPSMIPPMPSAANTASASSTLQHLSHSPFPKQQHPSYTLKFSSKPIPPPQPSTRQPPPHNPLPPHNPPFQPKRPTEMSPTELHKKPEFKALRRRWTGLIVGIPVLVATSYVLWNRFDMGSTSTAEGEGFGDVHKGRERGVLPGTGPVVGGGFGSGDGSGQNGGV